MSEYCTSDGATLIEVISDSTAGPVSYVCPECGSRYIPIKVPAANSTILYETWNSSWGIGWDGAASA